MAASKFLKQNIKMEHIFDIVQSTLFHFYLKNFFYWLDFVKVLCDTGIILLRYLEECHYFENL